MVIYTFEQFIFYHDFTSELIQVKPFIINFKYDNSWNYVSDNDNIIHDYKMIQSFNKSVTFCMIGSFCMITTFWFSVNKDDKLL